MSDGNNHNDELQDYLDLLDEYAQKDIKEEEKESVSSNKINLDVFDTDEGKKIAPPPFSGKIKNKTHQNKFIKKISDWYNALPKKKKIIIKVIAVILAIILVLSTVFGIFVIHKFGLLGDNLNDTTSDDIIYDDGEFEDIEIDIGSAGFKQALIDWATIGNDNHMSSKNVINVLLIGADSRKGTNSGNTDVMMLLSLNRKTKQLKLVSFLRDSYLYIEGKDNSYCTKLNAAFSMGGPETLVQTIENNYKIDIDNYVIVNFESFKSIIDAMGGVTVDVQQYEADYNYKKFKIELPVGEGVTLNGEQALCFCRIRGCDSDGDVSRTRRQRQVIDSIISRVKEASISDLNKYIDILLPYVETGYSEGQILSLGIKAVTGGWANYERTQLQMPPEDCRTSGSANMWIWVVDYQLAAHKLQMEIYGQSNITIEDGRTSIIDVYRGANYTGSGNSVNNNNSSDETEVPDTTIPATTDNITTTVPLSTENNQVIPETSENNNVTDNTEIDETENPPVEDSTQGADVPDTTEMAGDGGSSGNEEETVNSSGDTGSDTPTGEGED